ncbi:MAG TPA: FtsQ-type POTRA domain-containing protein [Rubrobacteraceae bacterium]
MALLLRKFFRPVAISGAVALLTAFVALTVSYLLFPVTGVEVEGARMFPESEAWQAFPEHASLLLLNLDALERRIESNPWVKGAKVLKDWESGIVTVEVEERRPVLDGDLGGRRIVLSADGTELPGLGGTGLERIEIDEVQLEEILRVSRVLEDNGVMLDSVDGVGAKGVNATVEGRSVLFAENVSVGQALALEGLIEEHTDAPYFDLRTPERVVVGVEPGKGPGAETGE